MGHKRDLIGNVIPNGEALMNGELQSHNTANSSKPTKRFECMFAGCTKSYTRAEHLGRHQLNHNPKDIYKCDFPGCTRTFVRQDLCVRHRERHDAPPCKNSESISSDEEEADPVTRRVGRPRLSSLNRTMSTSKTSEPLTTNANLLPTTIDSQRSRSYSTSLNNMPPVIGRQTQHSSSPQLQHNQMQSTLTGNINGFSMDMLNQRQFSNAGIATQQTDTNQTLSSTNTNDYALPALGADAFNESPASVRDEFTAWLFDENFSNPNRPFFSASMNAFGSDFMQFGTTPMFSDYNKEGLPKEIGFETVTSISDFEIMACDDIAWISSSKRSRLVELMQSRFIDAENKDITSLREAIFSGVTDAEEHILSLRSMQIYLGSYWKNFHRQLPILHQPTFSADGSHDLLVLAVMAIGAANLGVRHGTVKTTAAAKLATFMAWHLRWQIFMHADFRPPAKLWVFQTLLLLEVFEKTMSTRPMHERAHVHSATMINLMRRGTTLIGDDETARRTPGPSTADETWHRWIETESTRRAAFAAFVIDATHAIQFGHAAIMVVHEIRLLLPCDDALWSATSAAEVGRVHASLHTHGIKPTTFLDGLKRTLTGKKVKTNTFGRTILMAGLLSILWHLHQRDLQVSSLGASSSLGMPGTWREALSKSFDFWKRDFDESMSHMKSAIMPWHGVSSSEDRDACDQASALHHMSHLALNVEIVDCQIFCGAHKIFGRTITQGDHDKARHKMTEWAKTSGARNAVFHALQVLKPIILGATTSQEFYNSRSDCLLNRPWSVYFSGLVLWCYGYAFDGVLRPFPTHLPTGGNEFLSPDLSGSGRLGVRTPTNEVHFQAQLEDARTFFSAVGMIKSPDDLRMIQSGRNRLVGMLGLLNQTLRDSRWDLLVESAARFDKAIQILKGE